MTDPNLERRLGEAFDAAARSAVPDAASPPSPQFMAAPASRRSRVRWIAPLAAAAAVAAVAGSILALQGHGRGAGRVANPPAATGRGVQIKLATTGGQTYGVGMPVVAYFSRQFASAKSLSAATSVTVNGTAMHGAWYFERSTKLAGYPVEGHLRLQKWWPADATVTVTVAARQQPAGAGMQFSNDVQVSFHTGPQVVAIVDDHKHQMLVTRDGTPVGTYPVALGSTATPTTRGVKVIMRKSPSVCMRDVAGAYRECGIKYAQELTYSGEYLHSAPWNVANIKLGRDTSNGCTNLLPNNAATLYKVLTVGDVVEYPNASGPKMGMSAGYGDWNVPWRIWQRGGLIPTS